MRLLILRETTVLATFAVVLGMIALGTTETTAQTMRLELYLIQTVTLTGEQFLTGVKDGKPGTVAGELRIPRPGTERLPTVVLVHGSGGVGANVGRWAQELATIGLAAFVLDSFTGRGITNTSTDQSQLSSLAMMVDAYRALELLAKHRRIDPARIAVMGFSKGGVTALYASMKRFQRMHGPAGVEFAAYMPFYAPCQPRYIDDEDLSDKPIRLFHRIADDWVPIEPCRQYVERLRRAGKNVEMIEYPDAHHAFDAFTLKEPLRLPQAQTGRRCSLAERAGGQIVNRQTGQPFTLDDSCVERGTTVACHPQAHAESIRAVKTFLVSTLKLSP
jgi:dienelactone hydrolase